MARATLVRRWSLVPVLTCAGFLSGVYTSMVIEVMAYGAASPYPFTFFGSLSLALSLCAVLWAFGFIPSRKAAEGIGGPTFAPRPERLLYHANCASAIAGLDSLVVTVHVTQ